VALLFIMLAVAVAVVMEITQEVWAVLAAGLMDFLKMVELLHLQLLILAVVAVVARLLVALVVTVVLGYLLFLTLELKRAQVEQ
jgi:hypothetical protein